MALLLALSLLLLSTPLVLAIVRANELFLLRVRNGRVEVVRGRIPQRLLDDIGEILSGTTQAELRGVVEERRPRLYAQGDLDAARKQRLRNVIGEWSAAQIRTAPRAARRQHTAGRKG